MKSRFLYIVLVIMLVILVMPFIRHAGRLGWLTSSLLVAMIPLASYYALSADRKRTIVLILLSLPLVFLDALHLFYARDYLSVIMPILTKQDETPS